MAGEPGVGAAISLSPPATDCPGSSPVAGRQMRCGRPANAAIVQLERRRDDASPTSGLLFVSGIALLARELAMAPQASE